MIFKISNFFFFINFIDDSLKKQIKYERNLICQKEKYYHEKIQEYQENNKKRNCKMLDLLNENNQLKKENCNKQMKNITSIQKVIPMHLIQKKNQVLKNKNNEKYNKNEVKILQHVNNNKINKLKSEVLFKKNNVLETMILLKSKSYPESLNHFVYNTTKTGIKF